MSISTECGQPDINKKTPAESHSALASYVVIQEHLTPLIPTYKEYPHLSTNPLSGNSLY